MSYPSERSLVTMQKYFTVAVVLLSFLINNICCFQWDYFTFAQSWPPGLCAEGSRENHTCVIPEEVKTWTVHGLWPSIYDTRKPEDCNSSWHFSVDKVATIRADLDTYWPNMFKDTPVDSFWSHEWSKHGTCCTDLQATANELAYFTQGIVLNRRFDISSILADSGIIPSMTASYSFKDFMNAIQKSVGFEPVLQCQSAKLKNGTKFHLIGQIEICLDKNFSPRTCYSKQASNKDKLSHYFIDKSDYHTEKEKMKAADKDTLYFKKRQSVSGPQSDCPQHYNFYYPPVHYQRLFKKNMPVH